MVALARAVFWAILRWLLRRRYRVRVIGGENLASVHGPTLVMPNHPAYIDPPIVLSFLPLPDRVRPVVTEFMYRMPLLYPFMRLVDALEVPELGEQSHAAREQTFQMIEAIVAGIEKGGSFLLYPSGRVQRGQGERVGAARAAAEILDRCPQANVVLVRTRGLWGSEFSYARTGKSPELGRLVPRLALWMFANLVFFAPKREVTVTVEVVDRRRLAGLSRDELNRYLEGWYDQPGLEKPQFVPLHRLLGPQEFEFPALGQDMEYDEHRLRPATVRAVNEIVAERIRRPLSETENRAQTRLEEIGLDSLDRMDIALTIEDRFGFRSDRVAETLGELWALADGLLTRNGDSIEPAPRAWLEAPPRPETPTILADTIAEAFMRRAIASPNQVAVADRMSGVLTYRRMLVATRLLARQFAELPGEAIGILLPGSVAADIAFFGLHLIGRLPVMLNWTTGPANLAHAVKTLKIQKVVTSRKLIDRLGVQIEGAEYVFLEDLKARVHKPRALAEYLLSYVASGAWLRALPRPSADDPAVVLFTSGSESAPKAVPLTHRNLLTNARAGLEVLEVRGSDSMLGFLPPFHSFGLLGNIIVPILAGIPTVHHPDPTDATGLVRMTANYRPTLLITTPTFLGYMFAVARPDDLASVRIVVTGAEKCPDALFERAKQFLPHGEIVEGYGITECSPVVSGNRPGRTQRDTVGPPVRGVEVCIVDPESHKPLPLGSTGLLLVRGPSVFHGYLNYDGPDPFIELEGKRWYVTGDLVQLDADKVIHFRGRLKRFLKAGGEMISLPALEEPLGVRYPPGEKGPQVAVEGIETPEGRHIVLFTTLPLSLREANGILAEAGLRGVMRLDEVRSVEAIPVLGTGKTDYKVLRRQISAAG